MAEEASHRLEKDPSSLILWRSLIYSTRNNMAHCTVPIVLKIFTRAIVRLHQLRRGASKEFVQNIEEYILGNVYTYFFKSTYYLFVISLKKCP